MRTITMKPLVVAALCTTSLAAFASSHREAPLVAGMPRVDGTDFYMFRSYEGGRDGFVTMIANYMPLQDAYGGPNYFKLDPNALYEIHVDNNGDSAEDLTFQFRFTNTYKGLGVPTGASSGNVAVPLNNIGQIDANGASLNVVENYSLTLVKGNRRTGVATAIVDAESGSATFTKPVDNIGNKSIPDYASYANGFIRPITIPGCSTPGKVFVGQRHEGFVVNLGQVFDLVNLNPLGARDSGHNVIGDKNITSLAIEVPTSCLVAGSDPVIGAWTTASLRQSRVLNPAPTGPVASSKGKGPTIEGGAYSQVSRLGSPLVNEVVIGLPDKDKFNASEPKNDVANFGTYVLYPTLPVLVNALFQVPPPATPRNDLLAAFVTGITATVNGAPFKFTAPANLTVPGEMLRLNTAIAPTAVANQKDLGFLACDLAGFPNGRRPVDDVVDIELTAVEGAITAENTLNLQTCDVSGATPVVKNAGAVVNDGALPNPADYLTVFPYLGTPLPGAVTAAK
jgi:hypothetical protein